MKNKKSNFLEKKVKKKAKKKVKNFFSKNRRFLYLVWALNFFFFYFSNPAPI